MVCLSRPMIVSLYARSISDPLVKIRTANPLLRLKLPSPGTGPGRWTPESGEEHGGYCPLLRTNRHRLLAITTWLPPPDSLPDGGMSLYRPDSSSMICRPVRSCQLPAVSETFRKERKEKLMVLAHKCQDFYDLIQRNATGVGMKVNVKKTQLLCVH